MEENVFGSRRSARDPDDAALQLPVEVQNRKGKLLPIDARPSCHYRFNGVISARRKLRQEDKRESDAF